MAELRWGRFSPSASPRTVFQVPGLDPAAGGDTKLCDPGLVRDFKKRQI
jgi:hypothetical protein